MVGIAGSGKTTLARTAFPHHTHVSLDTIKKFCARKRQRILARYGGPDGGLSKTRRVEHVMVADALGAGQNVVVDDTNLTRKVRARHIALACKYGATTNAVFFQNIQRSYMQNRTRTGRERLDDGILGMHYAELEHPHMDEGLAFIQTMC